MCFCCLTTKEIPKLHLLSVSWGYSPVTGGFSPERADDTKNVSMPWRHHKKIKRHTMHTIVSWPNPQHQIRRNIFLQWQHATNKQTRNHTGSRLIRSNKEFFAIAGRLWFVMIEYKWGKLIETFRFAKHDHLHTIFASTNKHANRQNVSYYCFFEDNRSVLFGRGIRE